VTVPVIGILPPSMGWCALQRYHLLIGGSPVVVTARARTIAYFPLTAWIAATRMSPADESDFAGPEVTHHA